MALRNRKLPRHILVIRNSAMGDVAMVPHALRALREAYPDVRVTVLTRPLFKPFFAGLDVDFLEADYAGRHKGVLGLLRLAGEARRRGIDAVADMHGVLRSLIVGLCSGCTECRRRASTRGVSRSGSGWGVRIRPPRRSNIPSCVIATCCAVWASSSTIRSLRRSRYGRIRSGRKKECGSASHPFRRRRARP